MRSTINSNIQTILAQQLNCGTIGPGTNMNCRVSQSHTIGRRTRKIEPYGTNARALNPSLTPGSSRKTTNPRRLPPKENINPGRRKTGPRHTTSIQPRGDNPGMRKSGPRHTVSINPKGTSAGRGGQATRQLRLSSRLDGSCQVSRTLQGQHQQGTEPYSGNAKAQDQAVILNSNRVQTCT